MKLPRRLNNCLLLALAVPLQAVPVRIQRTPPVAHPLEGGERCTLSAQHPDGQPRAWRWSMRRGTGASLEPAGGGGSATFTAPMLVEAEDFSIHVEDAANPDDCGDLTFRVAPTYLFRELMPKVQGSRLWWGARLVPFAGEYPPEGKESKESKEFKAEARHFHHLREVHWIDDPGMGRFDHGFLALDKAGIKFVNIQGEVQLLLPRESLYHSILAATGESLDIIEITRLAVRPPDYRGLGGPHAVFACTARALYSHPSETRSLLFELRPDGTPRLLSSGALKTTFGQGLPADARLERTSFWRISCLAMDPDGAVFVAEDGPMSPTIYRTGPDGAIRCFCEGLTMAGHGDPGLDVLTGQVDAMVQDPASGVIYAVAGGHLLRIEPFNQPGHRIGRVTTLLRGNRSRQEPPGPSRTPARGEQPLYQPGGILFRQGRLFIADWGGNNIWVYDLRTGILSNLVGDPSQNLVRFGPVALAEPEGTPPGLCAALTGPMGLCAGPGDSLMIALADSMVMIPGGLHLGAGENAAPAAGPAAPAAGPAAPVAGPAAPAAGPAAPVAGPGPAPAP